MKKTKNLSTILFLLLFMVGCKKEDTSTSINPVIQFKTTSNYTFKDTTLAQGAQITIGINANSNGGNNLTNLLITSNDTLILLNYGFNATTLDKDFILTKNSANTERIKVIIRNSTGLEQSISLKLTKGQNSWNEIIKYNNIVLGDQNNATIGSFLSLFDGTVYLQADAFLNQAKIDILYYNNSLDFNTLASPGASIAGIFLGSSSPDNWTIKNTSYFGKNPLAVSALDFSNAQNDSLILANKFIDSGRKAKGLAANQVWSFQAPNGKYGLIKVNNVTSGTSNTISMDVQLQK